MSLGRSMDKNVKARLVINVETGIYYGCIKEAALSQTRYKYSTVKGKVNGSVNNNTPFIYA